MQIIETTDIAGVRSAVHTFGKPSTPLHFVVLPMVHLGDPTFYEQMEARLKECDLVVAEGVTGRSLRVRALTASYRWLAVGRRHGLVEQDIDFDSLGVSVVNPDVSASDLRRNWRRKISLPTSTVMWLLLIPLYTLGIWLFGSRRFIAKELAHDDLPSTKLMLASDRVHDVLDVIGHQRDKPLVRSLVSIHEKHCEEPMRVGVAWGAAHVPAVVTALQALGYRHLGAEWLTVFTVDP